MHRSMATSPPRRRSGHCPFPSSIEPGRQSCAEGRCFSDSATDSDSVSILEMVGDFQLLWLDEKALSPPSYQNTSSSCHSDLRGAIGAGAEILAAHTTVTYIN